MSLSPLARNYGQQKPPLGCPVNPSHPLARSAGGLWLFNEGAGAVSRNAVGSDTGALTGTARFANGRLSLSSGDYVNQPSQLASVTGGVGTFVVRAKVTAFGSNGVVFWGTNTGNAVYFQVNPAGTVGNRVFCFGASIDTGYVPQTGRMITYAFTSDGANLSYYEDGQRRDGKATTPTAFSTGAKSFHLGNWIGGALWNMAGEIDYALYLSRPLTPAEVAQLYQAPYAMFSQGLSRYYQRNSGLYLPRPGVVQGGFLGQGVMSN